MECTAMLLAFCVFVVVLYVVLLRTNILLFRPLYKVIIRVITGKCEILRIIESNAETSFKIRSIEFSLSKSRHNVIRSGLIDDDIRNFMDSFNYDNYVQTIIKLKRIPCDIQPRFAIILKGFLKKIHQYKHLLAQIQQIKSTPVTLANSKHEDQLNELWKHLGKFYTPLNGETKNWRKLGFQSNNPTTDFRGMGLLALENLVYFSIHYTSTAQNVLSDSHNQEQWFPFAVVGIHLTEILYQFMKDGTLKNHFYDAEKGDFGVDDFHEVYCATFDMFDHFWTQTPRDIMCFNQYREEFKSILKSQFEHPDYRPMHLNHENRW